MAAVSRGAQCPNITSTTITTTTTRTRHISCDQQQQHQHANVVALHSKCSDSSRSWTCLQRASSTTMPSLVISTIIYLVGGLITCSLWSPTRSSSKLSSHRLSTYFLPTSLYTFISLRLLLLPLLLSLFCLPFCPVVSALPDTINVGAVFTADRFDQEIAFRLAIKRINEDRRILPQTRLVPKIEHIERHDSFHADKKVCGLLRTGVVAIFDPLDGHISRHLQSICDAVDIPHIETRWDFKLRRANDLSINLYPRPGALAKAYVDIVKAWQWEQFVIVYEDNEGLFRLQDFFKEAQSHNWRIKLHQFEKGKPYRETFWKVKEDGEQNIILDVKNENLFRALKHAQQVGLITEAHSYLITQLDLHTIDLEDFKFGKTKITAFSLLDTNTEEHKQLMRDWKRDYPWNYTGMISAESALIYDAVQLLATAIKDLDQSQSIEIQVVSCETAKPWTHGSSLINYMRPVSFRGITGNVGFNEAGFRSSTTLEIVTVSPNGLDNIGTWSENRDADHRLNISRVWKDNYSNSLQNKTLIITTVINDPYTMIKDSSFKRTGNDQFEGYAIDLIAELAKLLHFKYEFHLVKDGSYGRPDKNGNWNGMMGELIRGEADLAVADLTITSKREDAVDFTHPFMNTGISILFKKPTKKVTSLFSFLSPFSSTVWIYVLCAYIGVSSMLFIVGRLSPYEWENPHPCRQDEQVLENGFSLSNSFWFTIGSLMQQASDLTPKAMSTRTIAAIWYFFTLIMIASYTANLAAFLTVEKIVYPIENAEGLAAQDKIKYGCLVSGSTASFFSESNITTYKRMWEFMSKNPKVLMKSNFEGRLAVERGEGTYAFLMESASIEYTVERNCNLTQIGGLLDSKGYGVATGKDSPYRMPLSQAILQLQESGQLLILKERWWKQRKGGGQCIDDAKKGSGSVTPLKIDNVGGVFVVLLGGLSFSLFVTILEFIWKSRNDLPSQENNVCEEMIHDLKFALMCQSSSKLVQRSGDDKVPNSLPSSPGDYYQHHRVPPPHYQMGSGVRYTTAAGTGGFTSPTAAPFSVTSPASNKRNYVAPIITNGPTSGSRQNTPKSRSNSRMGGSSGKLMLMGAGSEFDITVTGSHPLNESTHRNSSRAPLYHFDDCALVAATAGSTSALNYQPTTTTQQPQSALSKKSSNNSSAGGKIQTGQSRSVQYLLNHSQSSGTNSSGGKSASTIRISNGSRSNAPKSSMMANTTQSNSCSDLIMHEVALATGGGAVVPASRNTNNQSNPRKTGSMRSVGKMYSQSFDDEIGGGNALA